MAGEEGELCAICLDPPSVGALTLGCGHTFHAGCLLASFAGAYMNFGYHYGFVIDYSSSIH